MPRDPRLIDFTLTATGSRKRKAERQYELPEGPSPAAAVRQGDPRAAGASLLPLPASIDALQVTAAFHSIYLLNYTASTPAEALLPARARRPDGSLTLVLRISGNHIPHIKTANEVATMTWVREHTSIPVPAVVAWDDCSGSGGGGKGPTNPLGREFTLLEWVPGRSVDRMYTRMTEAAKVRLVQQLTDYLVEMNKFEWHHVGG
ncbi:hypothetical protein ACCO45_002239 [Purpureocillium lilacinum]|uniref:Uncharacterized protein n=1 Tax=Purpureocillium lilacinum TaxID=33203 RepID=A0ACC4E9B7_PURLI